MSAYESSSKKTLRDSEEERKDLWDYMWGLVLKGFHGRKLIVISPGGEEAGGRRKTEIIYSSGTYKASAQPQEFI